MQDWLLGGECKTDVHRYGGLYLSDTEAREREDMEGEEGNGKRKGHGT